MRRLLQLIIICMSFVLFTGCKIEFPDDVAKRPLITVSDQDMETDRRNELRDKEYKIEENLTEDDIVVFDKIEEIAEEKKDDKNQDLEKSKETVQDEGDNLDIVVDVKEIETLYKEEKVEEFKETEELLNERESVKQNESVKKKEDTTKVEVDEKEKDGKKEADTEKKETTGNDKLDVSSDVSWNHENDRLNLEFVDEDKDGRDDTTGLDKYLTDPIPEGKPNPVESDTTSINKQKVYKASLSIRMDTILDNKEDLEPELLYLLEKDGIKDGVIYETREVEFYEGESVFDVLLRETKAERIHMEFSFTPMYNSHYIEGINNFYEFSCGELSGWMYKVNDWFPNYGCSRYQLKDGDVIEWLYTCDLGRDLGEYWLGGTK